MKLRKYEPKDCAQLAELFYDTVHRVNAKDYSKAQLEVWVSGAVDLVSWNESFLAHNTVIAEQDGRIAGFGDMDKTGYLDRLYVHSAYQRQGIATEITDELERSAIVFGISRFTTHASITAKPFFEQRGYRVLRENTVVRDGVRLINFIMEKAYAKGVIV